MRYVVVGYVLTYGTLFSYIAWLAVRLRNARKMADPK